MKFSNPKVNHYYTRLLQEVNLRMGLSVSKPLEAILIMTYRCNARCVHCYSYDMPRMQELTTEEWKNTIDDIYDWLGPIFLSFTGGEALLRKDSIEIAEHAAKRGFWVEFLSNGWVLDQSKVERLFQAGINRLKISLDSTVKEEHDKIRGVKNFFERSYNALKLAAENKHLAHPDIQIYAKSAIMNYNVKHAPEVARVAKEFGIYGVEYQAIEPVYYSDQQDDPLWYKDNPLWINDTEAALKAVGEIRNMKQQGYPIVNSFESLDMMAAYFKDPDAEKHRVHTHNYKKKEVACQDWAKGLQIDPAGNLRMCHWMEPYGNVKDRKLAKQWNARSSCGRCSMPYK
ncbi:MAG TPA: radical SAM protein [Gammaproteobacteria bacterium]|nr:radical SAM protein [Gammaproteobacteria bacterium]